MTNVIASVFVSLDGVMEAPGPAHGVDFAGWTMPYGSPDLYKITGEELFGAKALLLGRVTYEGFAAAWPGRTDEAGFADRMNSMPKYVVTSSTAKLEWTNSHRVDTDLKTSIAKLEREADGDLLVAGSARLVQGLLAADLLDELKLMIYPVVIGRGQRLLDGVSAKLSLVESRGLGDVIYARYRRTTSK